MSFPNVKPRFTLIYRQAKVIPVHRKFYSYGDIIRVFIGSTLALGFCVGLFAKPKANSQQDPLILEQRELLFPGYERNSSLIDSV